MKRYLSLYLEFCKMNIKATLEYRIDFFIGLISSLIVQISGFYFIWLVFQNVTNLNGWSFYEIALVYGLLVLSRGFLSLLFDNLWVLGSQYIRTGNFDSILLRPIHPLFHLIASKFKIDAIGNIALGFVIITRSLFELKKAMSLTVLLYLVIAVICGTLIFAAINLITSSLSFWVVNSYHLTWATFSISDLALYPINIYNKVIIVILTWIIPYAFVSFYPANSILEKEYSGLSHLTPLVAVIVSCISLLVWKTGLRNYTSTGS